MAIAATQTTFASSSRVRCDLLKQETEMEPLIELPLCATSHQSRQLSGLQLVWRLLRPLS